MKIITFHYSLLTLFVLLLFCSVSYSQTIEEVVYLKNGSIIRGIIIEQVPNQSIKIQTKDRNVFFFKYDEIEKITKEFVSTNNTDNPTQTTQKEKENKYKKSGYTSILEAGYSYGVGKVKLNNYYTNNGDRAFAFRWTNGYQFNQHFSMGLGLGMDVYQKTNLIPIMADVRLNPFKGEITPSLILNAGKAFNINELSDNGAIFHVQLGVKTFISKNTAFLFNVGYKWQEYYTILLINYIRYIEGRAYYKFATARIGFCF